MWFEATVSPMLEDSVVWVARDITERKRAEQALAQSEGRLRQIIETEPECVKVLGANGSLLEMNPAGLAMIEADSLEQVRGRSVYRYIAPGHREAFVALTEKVLRGGSGTLEFELVGLKGTRRWLDTHAVPLRDAGGGASGLLAITRDITERKSAEAALKESERLYRTVIEQATENIFLIDVETRRIVESNRAFREALGYSEEELHRMTLYDVVAADRESVDRNLRRTLEEGRASVGERRYRRKDGTLLDVEASGSIILRDGRQTLVAVAHDITERARAQHLLEERVATLSGIAAELTLDRPTETLLGDLARSVVSASTAVACGIVLIGEREGAVDLFGSYGLPEGYTAGPAGSLPDRGGFPQPPSVPQPPSRPGARSQVFHPGRPAVRSRPSLCARGAVGRRVQPAAHLARAGAGRDLLLFPPRAGSPAKTRRSSCGPSPTRRPSPSRTPGCSLKHAVRPPWKSARGSPVSCTTPSPRPSTA